MPKKKGHWKGASKPGASIGEEVRIAVTIQLKKFAADPTAKECEFPSSFYAEERAYVHEMAKTFGFRSKSRGQHGIDRAVRVYKGEVPSQVQTDPVMASLSGAGSRERKRREKEERRREKKEKRRQKAEEEKKERKEKADRKKKRGGQYKKKLKKTQRGIDRSVTVYKREGSSIVQADPVFSLAPVARQQISVLLRSFPLSNKERQDLLPQMERDRERDRALNADVKELNRAMGRLSSGISQVPTSHCNPELLPFRKSLPIWSLKDEIMRTINTNQVVVLVGETGSGKTTQVPQFILEHSASANKACRIVCTEPRRISAVSVSERVAAERDEKLGQSVGYQIRLESRVSPKTVLTYCTNGVLLRTLMGGDCVLATMTHIIVDEIHERDRFSDFLLIALRDALSKFRMLRLILMSATIDTNMFTKYFNGCPVISVPGKTYEVKEYFLEDVLKVTGYMDGHKAGMKAKLEQKRQQKQTLEKWTKRAVATTPATAPAPEAPKPPAAPPTATTPVTLSQNNANAEEATDKDKPAWYVEEMDSCIEDAWLNGSQNAFAQMLYLIQTENVSVDYQHSKTSATPLMVAAGRGCVEETENLLNIGANANIRASNNWTALDWAEQQNQTATAELIRAYMKTYQDSAEFIPDLPTSVELSTDDRQLLELYHGTNHDDSVDWRLCVALIKHIHNSSDRGAILVFLPGYDDIVSLRDLLTAEESQMSHTVKFRLYTLHSKMQTTDQKRVFQPAPPNTRKIILSTNIAETSITIDDVVYVIDTGKVKEKSYDSVMGVTSLKDEWISVACAKQRKGRAGRTQPGVCYHMFSSLWYQTLPKNQTPEILRMPIHELCLHTKLLAPPNTAIADFLARAMEPPAFMVTRNAVQLLKTIDALDPWEDLTELGHHLLDLPVEPRLGKMLLHAVLLKCLDPVLTIVCILAYKDPFVMPSQPVMKLAAKQARRAFSANTFSDHMVLLRAFQAWQSARTNGIESVFCKKNFISSATMEQVVSLRTQLLGQLRASGFVRPKGGGDIRDLNTNADNWAVVKAAITAGMYPNLVRVDRETNQLRTMKECTVRFHPSSTVEDSKKIRSAVVANLPTDWLVYDELSRSGRLCHVRSCTLVSPITIALFGGPMRLPLDALSTTQANDDEAGKDCLSDSEWEERPEGRPEGRSAMLKLDDWIVFCVDAEAAQLALHLRHKWNALFLRRMRGPAKTWSAADDAVIQAVVRVLTVEEQVLGLQQPEGIGQRPRPLNIEFQPATAPSSSNRRFGDQPEGENLFASNLDNSGHRLHRNNGRMYEIKGQDRGWSDGNSDWRGADAMGPLGMDRDRGTGDTRYLIIKAGGPKAIEKSMACGLWAFTPNTERKVVRLFKEGKNVRLIFSMQGSGSFQGVARLVGDHAEAGAGASPLESHPELTGPNLGSLLPVEWIKCGDISFQATRHLVNPYTENRRVQASRDGQELEAGVAAQLCSLWDKVPQFGHQHQHQMPHPLPHPHHPHGRSPKGMPPMPFPPHQHPFYPNQMGSQMGNQMGAQMGNQMGRPIRGGYYPQSHFNNGGFGRNNHHHQPHIHK